MSEFVTQKRAELVAVNAAIADAIANGESYTVSGSHAVNKVKLADLRAERARIIKELSAYVKGSASSSYTMRPKYD